MALKGTRVSNDAGVLTDLVLRLRGAGAGRPGRHGTTDSRSILMMTVVPVAPAPAA